MDVIVCDNKNKWGHIKSELFLAEYRGRMINSTIVLFFNNTATMLHAGSDCD